MTGAGGVSLSIFESENWLEVLVYNLCVFFIVFVVNEKWTSRLISQTDLILEKAVGCNLSHLVR